MRQATDILEHVQNVKIKENQGGNSVKIVCLPNDKASSFKETKSPPTLPKHQKMHNVTTKKCLYNFVPRKSHFYIVKLRFTRVYIIFLISAQNIDFGYSARRF